ncbi:MULTISPECIES: hypothetical protein [Streptomyces]|uniref:hypothetical protein n=1 Tax=Streptomyces TaxID=1883 RepID=UPI001EFB5AC5|nr:hypothetical protein [Streptomyces sp. CL12-4]
MHACERAVVSACASARQLVEDADRTRTMHREAALVASRHPEVTVTGGTGREAASDGRAAGAAPLPPVPASRAP